MLGSFAARARSLATIALFMVLGLAGCTDAPAPSVPPTVSGASVPATVARREGRLVLRIRVPRKHARLRKGSHFISPSTQGMTVQIKGPTTLNKTVSLQPTATGCSSSLTGTLCTLTLALSPCPTQASCYSASVATYDAVQCTNGTCSIPQGAVELSADQHFAFTVATGQPNAIGMTLFGIPHGLSIAGSGSTTVGAPGGLELFGAAAQKIVVSATDGDGNLIVGAGSPTYAASISAGNSWSVSASPAPSTPNTLVLTPSGVNGSRANLHLVATASQNLCAQAGAVCTADFPLSNVVQSLIVLCASCGGYNAAFVQYSLPYTGAFTHTLIVHGTTGGFALDSSGFMMYFDQPAVKIAAPPLGAGGEVIEDPNLFTNQSPTIMLAGSNEFAYVRPDNNKLCTFAAFAFESCFLPSFNATSGAMNAANDILIGDNSHLYLVPANGPAVSILGSGLAGQVLIDNHQNLFAVTPTKIIEYAPDGAGYPVTLINPGLANASISATMDANGDIFAAASGTGKIVEVAPPYQSVTATITVPSGSIGQLAVDAFGNLYAVNSTVPNVVVYAPPYNQTSPTTTIPVAATHLAVTP